MESIVQSIGALVNTTLSSATYTEASSFGSALKANSLPNDLYAGHDWDSLNYPEQLWARWYMYIGDPVLATGIMSFLIHEFFYFGRCIPWIFVDKIPYFRKYKLQENKEAASWEEQWACTKYVLFTHFTIELPQIFLFGPTCDYFGLSTHHVPFPSIKAMAAQIALFFFVEDFYHYWAHRALHWGPLYKKIHKLHHNYSAPFGLAAEYAHPLEILILGMGTIGGPFAYCVLSGGNLHIITVYVWIILRLFQAVDAHSGYDFPWSLNKIFPLWAGADHHDHHHESFVGCYSTSFRHMDYIFGTDAGYHAKRSAQKEAKKLAAAAAKAGAAVLDTAVDAGNKVVDAGNKLVEDANKKE